MSDEEPDNNSEELDNNSTFADVALESLAPQYVDDQHGTYVVRLLAAVDDRHNRNIALTGGYGTGKSSILNEFRDRHGSKAMGLSISTLGTADVDASLTNRLQKEVVKQLLYGAPPTTVRNSRFKRIRVLPPIRAGLESMVGTVLVGFLLHMTGFLPMIVGTEPGRASRIQIISWVSVILTAACVVTVLRLLTFDRFVVSNVAGALTLTKDTSTFFDDYLDEIVHYFDTADTDVVIFEDLDRFDDPMIFEALRELNTILNSTPTRRSREQPLRFIYAVKDSLFEQLGRKRAADPNKNEDPDGDEDPNEETQQKDAVALETERANRTKFFDLVIPVVPFISHRNARELLSSLLADAGVDDVPRDLIDVVATHTTDMRLMKNLVNEYLVFAERLLGTDRVAPGLRPSELFALLSYKMFHMEDFENIARHRSDLDDLYREHRRTVRSAVASRQRQLRDLARRHERAHSRADRAAILGSRLDAMTTAVLAGRNQGAATVRYEVDGDPYEPSATGDPAFWAAASRAGALAVEFQVPGQAQWRPLFDLSSPGVDAVLPEAGDADAWDDIDQRDHQASSNRIRDEIAAFRGAGFRELLALDEDFPDVLAATLASDLARDLVRRGYLTRHFSVYAAQFYGDFAGVDVLTFIMQTVETNTVDLDYTFETNGAVANLLVEVPDGFTMSVSALNVAIVDHLLDTHDARQDDIAQQIIERRSSDDVDAFLGTYMTSGRHAPRLTARLAVLGWPDLFHFLTSAEGVPDDRRIELTDAALSTGQTTSNLDVDEGVAAFLRRHHGAMPTFTATDDRDVARSLAALVERCGWLPPELETFSAAVSRELIARSLYAVTPDNLRAATGGQQSLSLDVLREHPDVYEVCLGSPGEYLSAVAADPRTAYTVERSSTLLAVLEDVAERWSSTDVASLLDAAASSSRLADVRAADESHWDALASADLVVSSIATITAFLGRDTDLGPAIAGAVRGAARLDADVRGPHDAPAAKQDAVVAVLNCEEHLGPLDDRIRLVGTLDDVQPVPADRVDLTDPSALAALLDARLVEDTLESFTELRPSSWDGMRAALAASHGVANFATPDLLRGFIPQILATAPCADRFGPRIIGELASYVGDDDRDALTAVGRYAAQRNVSLAVDEVQRIAAAAASDAERHTVVELLHLVTPAPSPDQLVAALGAAGGRYTAVATGGRAFDVQLTEASRAVFDRLKAAGRVSSRKLPMRDVLRVKPRS